MADANHYASFIELARHEAGNYEIAWEQRDSPVAILAIHGGTIEHRTDEIARVLAGESFSWYTFRGLLDEDVWRLHVYSGAFNEPQAQALAAGALIVCTIHGCQNIAAADGAVPEVVIGGAHQLLKRGAEAALADAGFACYDADKYERAGGKPYTGRDPENICNKGRINMGLQLELASDFRKRLLPRNHQTGRREAGELLERFCKTLRGVLNCHALGAPGKHG